MKSKKSTEWLEPLRLDEKASKAFYSAVSTKPSKEVLEKQVKLFEIAQKLRKNNISTVLYPVINDKLDKQLKYADKKGIPYVVIIGPEEAEKKVVKLKDMKSGDQQSLTIKEVIKTLNIKT